MKYGKYALAILIFSSLAAAAGSALFEEYERRSKLKQGIETAAAISFLGTLGFPIVTIEEIEVLNATDGIFLIRDNRDVICSGDWVKLTLTCKNKIGLTTYQGDGD